MTIWDRYHVNPPVELSAQSWGEGSGALRNVFQPGEQEELWGSGTQSWRGRQTRLPDPPARILYNHSA